jgi:flagellar motor switch protein FliM
MISSGTDQTNDAENKNETVTKEIIRALQIQHEKFSHIWQNKLQSMLQACVEVKLATIDRLIYSEFIFGVDNPTCCNLLTTNTGEAHNQMVLDINLCLAFQMIDHMCGGGREPSVTHRRALQPIEEALMEQIIIEFCTDLARIWAEKWETPQHPLDIRMHRTEYDPRMILEIPLNAQGVCIVFEITIMDIRGVMSLFIPNDTLLSETLYRLCTP